MRDLSAQRGESGWVEDGRLTGRRACAACAQPSLASYVTLTLCTNPSFKPQSLAKLASIKPGLLTGAQYFHSQLSSVICLVISSQKITSI